VITLGRAGEDGKSFKITDLDSTVAGFAGADYDLQVRGPCWCWPCWEPGGPRAHVPQWGAALCSGAVPAPRWAGSRRRLARPPLAARARSGALRPGPLALPASRPPPPPHLPLPLPLRRTR
jgi:hypothetical protein